jgi:hypothetical protein
LSSTVWLGLSGQEPESSDTATGKKLLGWVRAASISA